MNIINDDSELEGFSDDSDSDLTWCKELKSLPKSLGDSDFSDSDQEEDTRENSLIPNKNPPFQNDTEVPGPSGISAAPVLDQPQTTEDLSQPSLQPDFAEDRVVKAEPVFDVLSAMFIYVSPKTRTVF
ncbi:uncharacterized protein LOC126888814 [Diabrotica virgifera virgifera]|uniref:Uncharacterized protein n=1 Tax=Diabrotica virgifera virgifera TaxID=50390 RepID=A0ABM5KSK4_DIAVI|nr:uncharacterized protein LOC126888814 [Diabrotica virgifera virgifera]